MRKYEDTHKWLKFDFDLRSASPELWLMLGECQSKCEHLAKYPIRPDIADEIHKLYLAKGALATTAIEGNTLTEAEVRQLLDGKLELPPSRQYLKDEIDNIVGECNQILEKIGNDDKTLYFLSAKRIKEINAAVLHNLNEPEHVVPGQFRNYDVGVGIYKGAPYEDCDFLVDRMAEWLNGAVFSTPVDPRAKVYAILKAVVAHLYIAWIHPFGNGNGRTARMIEYQVLMASGIPSPAAHLLSNHYYHTQTEYYRQLQYASDSGGDILPFIQYAVQGFLDGLKEQLAFVKMNVMEAVWRNYIADQFRNATTPSDLRRKDLIEDLSTVVVNEIVDADALMYLTPRLTKHYKDRSRKTLLRDLKTLHEMGLIKFEKGMIQPRKESILAFVPLSNVAPSL